MKKPPFYSIRSVETGGAEAGRAAAKSYFWWIEKIVSQWKIVQNYKTSWNSSKFIDVYNISVDLETRDGILSAINSERFSNF